MKKQYIFLAGLMAIASHLFGQELKEADVPQAVVSSFKTKYPAAANTEWKKNKSGKYEADFKLEDKKAEAKFQADGQWDSSELRISAKDLPAPIAAYLKENYGTYKIEQIELKEDTDAAKNTYEVQVKKDKAETELVFDTAGKFLKKKDKDKKS